MRAKFVRGQHTKKGLDVGIERTRKVGDLVKIKTELEQEKSKNIKELEDGGYILSEKGHRNYHIIKYLNQNHPEAELEIVRYQDWNDTRNIPIDPPQVGLDISKIVPDYLRKYSHGYDNILELTLKNVI